MARSYTPDTINTIDANTLAKLATLTSIGAAADILTNSHCPSNFTSNNTSHCSSVNTAKYGTYNGTKARFTSYNVTVCTTKLYCLGY